MKRRAFRLIGLLMALVLLSGLLPVYAVSTETVAEWVYSAVPTPDATKALATNGANANKNSALLTSSQGTSMTYSTSSLSVKDWTAAGAYWQIQFSTKGYKDLTIAARARSSGTGPRDFVLQYSTDGANFSNVNGSAYQITKTALGDIYQTPVVLPQGIDDQEAVYIRFVVTSTTSSNGTGTVADTGTSNINSIILTGTPVSGGEPEPETKCATPTASPGAGIVAADTVVTFSCTTDEAGIQYNTAAADAADELWTTGSSVTVTADTTYYVRAVKAGLTSSDVTAFAYTVNRPGKVYNIKEALALTPPEEGLPNVTVTGQIVYFATSYSNPVLQDTIDGQVYSLYVFGAAPTGAKAGDTVNMTGTYKVYNGLPELASPVASEIVDTTKQPMAPETITIAQLLAGGANRVGRFVKIKDVTLGTYTASGSTPVTDATGTANIYKAAAFPEGVVKGDTVDLYAMVAIFNSTIQLYTGTAEANGYNVYEVVNDTKPPVITLPDSLLDAKTGQDYSISVGVSDNKGIKTVTISYTVGGTVKTDLPMIKNAETGKYAFTIPAAEIAEDAGSIKFTVKATDVSDLLASTAEKTVPVNSKPQITAVTPDRNGSTGDVKRPEFSVTLSNAGTEPAVVLTLKKDNAAVISHQAMTLKSGAQNVYVYTPDSGLESGKYTASVTVTRKEDGAAVADAWGFTVGKAQYTAYFGQLHAHTAQYSDGSGTLQDGLNYISKLPDSENVDFEAFTDHSNYFDTTSAANPADALNDAGKMTAESRLKWDTYRNDMYAFNTSNAGKQVALPGFEMTWSGGPGHINTFNSKGLVSRNNTSLNSKTSDAGMKLYYDTLVQDTDPLANLSQFNHPGKTFGTFNDFAYWSPSYDTKMVAVEVGNGEGSIGSGGYFPSYTEYTKALDKGWHVAPTNNQDNHKGNWGNSNTARTVIITEDLSADGLLQGMKNRSVYSTEDKNLNISYTVNDQMLGSTISDVPAEPLKFAVNIDDPDSSDVISKAEIVTNGGRVAASKSFAANSAGWEFELPAAKGYYYVRVTQADKNIAVTAPVWVGQGAVLGISSLESDTRIPVTGEAAKLITTLYNNEQSGAVLKSITYRQGNTVLTAETPGTAIAANGGTLQHIYSLTPAQAGTAGISVAAVLTLNGEDKEFTATLSLDVRDSSRLVYVGIDASHCNEYVDGNYKDNMGNFTNMAADYDVRTVELKTSAELIAAAGNPKYKMLVLTPPTRRNGSNFLIGYKSYSDEEINAVAAFAKAGGAVIVTSWGDYYEGYKKYTDGTAHTLPADQHMAAQQNKLLAAIGSSLRVSDDEIKNDTNNGGQAQRLYLTDHNMSHPFLKGVKSEQVYSNYGGSTIYAVGADRQPVSALPASVSPMVYASAGSYSADDDKDNFAGVTIPTYNGKYMVAASETVSHAGGQASTVIVTGAVFMSNFEIQAEMDYYGTPAYSNYTILQNVVSSLSPTEITGIAEVQKADEGQTFTIRGMATSNASGYDKATAFFDCIYVQDSTGGINAFPVSGSVRAGQTVEIRGTTSSYNGERQIVVSKITVVDDTIQALPAAASETTAQAAGGANLGRLVTVKGTVTRMTTPGNVVESIYVKDSSGTECRVFIDGYITQNKVISNLAVGAALTATGLSSVDTEGPRIRIRDRADIVCKSAQNGGTTPPDGGGSSGSDNSGSKPAPIKVIGTPTTGSSGTEQTAKITQNAVGTSDVEVVLADNVIEIPNNVFNNLLNGDGNASLQIKHAAPSDVIKGKIQIAAEKQKVSPIASFNFDITRVSGSTSTAVHKLSGTVKVTIALTAQQIAQIKDVSAARVYYFDSESGTFSDMQAIFNLAAGEVTFSTNHFSTYVIAVGNSLAAGASMGESLRDVPAVYSNNTTPPASAVGAGIIVGLLVLAALKKHRQR